MAVTLLLLLISAFAVGPVAVFLMSERSAASATTGGTIHAPPEAPVLTDAQLRSLALEVRSQYLDDRAESINWWLMAAAVSLAAITVFVTAVGILMVVSGFIGYRWFRDILDDARRYTAEAQTSATEAQTIAAQAQTTATRAEQLAEDAEQTVERIREAEREAQQTRDAIGRSTAEDAAKSQELQRLADQMSNLIEVGDLDRTTAEAIRLQSAGNNSAAIQKWQAIANLAEGNDDNRAARARFSIGYLHGQRSEYELASNAYVEAIRLDPTFVAAYNNRGTSFGELNRFEDALGDFNSAVTIDPEYAGSYYNRGNARVRLGDYALAIADLDYAIQLEPDYPVAYMVRAGAKCALGDYEAALADAEMAISADPSLPGAYNHRGLAKFGLGRFQEAKDDYDNDVLNDPDNPIPYSNRAEARIMLGEYEHALEDCNLAIERDPESASAYYNRGRANSALAQTIEARSDFVTSLNLAERQSNSDLKEKIEQALADLERTN